MVGKVLVQWDEDAGRWCSTCEELPMFLEADTLRGLVRENRIAAVELMEELGKCADDISLKFEVQSIDMANVLNDVPLAGVIN
ncbi:MAG: DUF1902 domain-containing protein [Spirochaetaceae bacterium]|jgi:hypothetical protein|nr:DUF1902 domain-containing protein [Spirochaetaceae bacterium]